MTNELKVSAIVPVGERFEPTGLLAKEYLAALKQCNRPFDLIFVLDDQHKKLLENLVLVAEQEPNLRIILLTKSFGEATAFSAGLECSDGPTVLTLPAYPQVIPQEIAKLLEEQNSCDMVIGNRHPRAAASKFEVFRRKVFHWLVKTITRSSFNDLGCNVRAFRRIVADEVPVYGDQFRFIPLLASRRGFRVREIKVLQSPDDRRSGRYGLKTYLRRLLDIVTIVFLVRFTKKPLRFFGMIGSVTFICGSLFLLYLVIERLLFDVALADRPALLLSSLLVVLGLQIFALGLLGELIIFVHARELKEYTIDKIVNE